MTQFRWIRDDYVVAIDRDDAGNLVCFEASVATDGSFRIVDVYTLPAEQSRKTPAQ